MKKYCNRSILVSLNLPLITDISSLSRELRLSEKLVYFLASEKTSGKYKTFKIPKHDGSFRTIYAPVYSLKLVQRWVLENILYKIKVSEYSYGFKNDKNGSPLVACGNAHKENLYLLKMDIKDFYPSIQRKQVYRQFINVGYNTYAANLLTNLCYCKDGLPQGAVTSAYLANLICHKLDIRISEYCNKRDITYTRYADDLAFSSNNRDALRRIYKMIIKIVNDEGFEINDKKTQFLTPKGHKVLLGLTMNDSNLKAPKEMKKKVRCMIHNSIITGDYSLNPTIMGYISYISSVEKNYKEKIKKYINKYYEDPITLFQDAVDSFNRNKLFQDLPDMQVHQIEKFEADPSEAYNAYESFFEERKEFITRHNKK